MNEELIISHYRKPNHYGKPVAFTSVISVANPLCGDEVVFYATRNDGNITDLSFTGSGCSICLASASILLDLAYEKHFIALQNITEEDLLSTVGIPKDHKRSACVLLSLTALQKLLKEA